MTIVGTTLNVMVRKDFHPALIGLLAQAMVEAHGRPGIFQQAHEFPTLTDPEYPVSEIAQDFYKDGPSFLNRYLPFWMTNYAKRTIAVLATVIAIIVPLFSYAPKLYRGLVENRLRSMYRRLRAIEASLQKDVGIFEVSALEADLEGVDRAMHILGVPMRHSDLFFSLKAHIDLVRARLGSRRAELHSKMIKAA